MALTDRRELAAVFVGGGIGTLARAGLTHVLAVPPGHWPWATFLVNIAGAAVLGFVATRLDGTDRRRSLWGTGFCGGLTTFSTMQVETVTMLEHGHHGLAAGYTVLSIGLGLLVVHACTLLTRRVCRP